MGFFQSGGLISQLNVTATAAGTTTLVGSTSSSSTLGKQIQVFTGVLGQTVVLPNATTMVVGQSFQIFNQSTGALTLQFNGGAAFTDAGGKNFSSIGSEVSLSIVLQTNGTSAGTWAVVAMPNGGTIPSPTVQKFLSGSGTYTTPATVSFITIEMVGGGGGGAGSGTTGGSGSGGTGGNTTFQVSAGPTLLVANGGVGGSGGTTGSGGAGGTASLGTGPIGVALSGGQGQGMFFGSTGQNIIGGSGGNSAFGGAGGGGGGVAGSGHVGNPGAANTGGGGGGASPQAGNYSGDGGGAGGYVKAIITSPSVTYTYNVGAAGTAGTAGSGGSAGGAGGLGIIVVTEYYSSTYSASATIGAPGPTIQKYLTGSGTYTTPANVSFITVEMVGGGGGGSSDNITVVGTNGGNTTFQVSGGPSLLVANGGQGGQITSHGAGGTGGTASLGTGPIGIALSGANGSGVSDGTNSVAGIPGASTPFGGGGGGGSRATSGTAAPVNTGAGGGGTGGTISPGSTPGTSGGAGGYVKAVIVSPSATYAYVVGASGAGATNNLSGGAGGSGIIVVTEYYYNGLGASAGNGGAYTPVTTVYTSSGTYTKNANLSYVEVTTIGGGGGGGNNTGSTQGGSGGGGAGGSSFARFAASSILSSETITIGTGGAINSGVAGSAGGATSFGGHTTSNGGGGGGGGGGATTAHDGAAGGAGGTATGGLYNVQGQPGSPGSWSVGGSSIGICGTGGSSLLGLGGTGGPGVITNTLSAIAGTGYGSGGGGGNNGGLSATTGQSGIVIVTEYYNNGAVGTATTITGSVPSAQVLGTTAAGNAPTGFIGEFVSANPGSRVAVGSSGAFVTITSINVTAGDWDVEGTISLVTGATTAGTIISGGISLNTTSEDSQVNGGVFDAFGTLVASSTYLSPTGKRRINVNTTTTINLVASATYTIAGGATWGTSSFIGARRVR